MCAGFGARAPLLSFGRLRRWRKTCAGFIGDVASVAIAVAVYFDVDVMVWGV